MGTCASNKKQIVVRQSSSIKFPSAAVKSVQRLEDRQQQHSGSRLFKKQDSDLNLLPPELQKNWTLISDESVFEREKRMVVLLASCHTDKPSQLALIDVDFQSPGFGKVICRLSLPLPGEELFSLACMRNTHSVHREDMDHLTSEGPAQFTLVVPVPSHSRIYVLTLMDGTMATDSGSLGKRTIASDTASSTASGGGLVTQMRIQKCITREELSRWDLGAPLCVCSNSAGRSSEVPLLVVTAVDRNGHCKGDLFRLDRRTFCPVDRRRRSITEEDRQSSYTSTHTTSSSSESPVLSGPSSTSLAGLPRFSHFGGALAISLRHKVVVSTEWGDLDRILTQPPDLRPPQLGSQDALNDTAVPVDSVYGDTVNVWDMRRRTLIQKIRLDPQEDGRWPICIRMVHHHELTHGFICTALGSSLFHLHKSSKTGLFSADRVAKFCPVEVGQWPGEVPEVPAMLTDMAISMDDQFLYVCAAFHGFVAQMNISDPFRPSLTQKVFLGGIVYRCLGIMHGGKTPMGKESVHRSYNTERRVLGGRTFEGGPCRMQLSLDGRRLFISNSFLRNWDEHFFPQMAERGSSMVLVHIDPVGSVPMKLDMDFAVNFDVEAEGERNGTSNGVHHNPQQQQHRTTQHQASTFYAREMRFLNGDSTSDCI